MPFFSLAGAVALLATSEATWDAHGQPNDPQKGLGSQKGSFGNKSPTQRARFPHL